ncbi:extracellular calcium-sensing receptor-like [Pleurodeles waltl]|uniref:extracellular calcium-sensing receptor-like n=1 Tax=Pleurodeles waltl TaxID=8319 RepID=UPI003709C200
MTPIVFFNGGVAVDECLEILIIDSLTEESTVNEAVDDVSASRLSLPSCHLQKDKMNGFSRDGDIIIGATFPIHDSRVYQDITFREPAAQTACQMFVSDNYQWLQAMVFAIEDINKNPDLLPNITLGFWIHDSCMILQRGLKGSLWMLTGKEEPIPNYQCWTNRPLAAIIGDSVSTRSIILAHILSRYRYPQISYSSTSPLLSDRNQFPSFFRTIPSSESQIAGLVQMVIQFGWTWVGLLVDDSDYGQHGFTLLKEKLVMAGTCIEFSEYILTSRVDKNALRIVQVLKTSTTKVVIIFSNDIDLAPVLNELVREDITGKIWVASDGWSTSVLFSMERYSKFLAGTIGIESHSEEILGFKTYLSNLHPLRSLNDMFIEEFWENTFGCTWLDLKSTFIALDNSTKPCTGLENLENIHAYHKDVASARFTYQTYNAVYAIALAVQDLHFCRPGAGPFHQGTCADTRYFQPWQLLHYVEHVHLEGKAGTKRFFDEHGNPPAQYDIMNWQHNLHGPLKYVKVGDYDASAPPGETLIINSSAIQWNTGKKQIPLSVCSPSCPPGHRKARMEGEPACCFHCVLCAQGEIANQTDTLECSKCPWDQLPNESQDFCIPKTTEFLSFNEPLGAMLTAVSLFSSMLPAIILGLFLRYRKTPIVRANNRSISYLLLLSLTLCFLSPLGFIGSPTPEMCLLRQVAFGITFALCVSCILAKTITVVIAFSATKPNSEFRRWTGPMLSYMIIGIGTGLQVILCVSWLSLSPPFSEHNTFAHPGKIIFECNEGSPVAFWCMLGYLGLLASVSFIVAFLARKLPDSFNEAQFITFSMFAFLSVWLSFIPAYLSTKGKYMVAMEVFAILSSLFSLVSCIFFPKCYIILLKPEINTKEHLMGRGGQTKVKRI